MLLMNCVESSGFPENPDRIFSSFVRSLFYYYIFFERGGSTQYTLGKIKAKHIIGVRLSGRAEMVIVFPYSQRLA